MAMMPRVESADMLPFLMLVKLQLDSNRTPVDRQVQKVEEVMRPRPSLGGNKPVAKVRSRSPPPP